MKPCPYPSEARTARMTLLLLGELSPEEERRWEVHLAHCPRCRNEYIHLQRLFYLGNVLRERPTLSTVELLQLSRAIEHRVRSTKHRSPLTSILKPLAIAGCFCAILLSTWSTFVAHRAAKETRWHASHLLEDDEEVISNFELLREFETIEKLIKVLDEHEDSSS